MSKDDKDVRPIAEPIDRDDLDAAIDVVRAAMSPAALDVVDHEALIAMTLGDDVSEISDDDRVDAEVLRLALEGTGTDPLALFAASLKHAHVAAGRLSRVDNELLLALTLGDQHAQLDDDDSFDGLGAAAAATRASLEAGSHELAMALCAVDGASLDSSDHELLVAMTLGDDHASIDELDDANVLRLAIAGDAEHPLADFAGTLRACDGRLRDIDELGHERILRRVLLGADPRHGEPARRGGVVATLVALAAAVALFAGSWQWLETQAGPTAQRAPTQVPAAELVGTHSTAGLFDPMMPFASKGGESERMGRIVNARAADLRANRFASWGVK